MASLPLPARVQAAVPPAPEDPLRPVARAELARASSWRGAYRCVRAGSRAVHRKGAARAPFRTTNYQLPLHRVVAQLEVHHLALGALAALDVPHEVRTVVGPQPSTLPSGLRIVD